MPAIARDVKERLAPLAPGFGARVNEVAGSFRSRQAAAQAMLLSPDQLAKIVQERAVPSFPAMAALARAGRVSFDWLAFGEGPKYLDHTPVAGEMYAPRQDADLRAVVPDDFVWVPVLDVRACAGGAISIADHQVGSFPVPRAFVDSIPAPKQLVMIAAAGDSMKPKIHDGDLMLVNLQDTRPRDELIYIVQYGDELLVKKIVREPSGAVLLTSEEEGRQPQRVRAEELRSLQVHGRVHFAFGRV